MLMVGIQAKGKVLFIEGVENGIGTHTEGVGTESQNSRKTAGAASDWFCRVVTLNSSAPWSISLHGLRAPEEENMSPVQQHNLHLTYREILAKSSATARSQAFAQLVAALPKEELEYLDGLVARDLCQALEQMGLQEPECI
jgi:hypothetical protein